MKIPINNKYKKCIEKISGYKHILDNYEYKGQEVKFFEKESVYFYIPKIKPQSYIAAFDIDWTITFSERKLFPSDIDDVSILPYRIHTLHELFINGYTIVFFTNQKAKGKATIEKKIGRMTTLINKLPFPVYLFMATGDNEFRKPEIGMWKIMKQFIPNIEYSFYVGDALGRPQDFSDSDKLFAENIGINYYSPEEFFPPTPLPDISSKKNIVVLVGMPGSGKSTISNHYREKGFTVISRDLLGGSYKKVVKALKDTISQGSSIVIDATNSKQTDREEYYNIAKEYGYTVNVLYVVRNGTGYNNLRGEDKVPMISYHMYYKHLVVPTVENTPGNVYTIT